LPDRRVLDLSASPAAYCYSTVASAVSEFGGEHGEYWKMLGAAMGKWADLF